MADAGSLLPGWSWPSIVFTVAVPLVLSSPWWLPPYVVALRMWLFTKVNGDDGMQFPNADVPASSWKALYSEKAVRLRSRQASVGLSDLFWYFLVPSPDIHQEHVETGTELHKMVALGTKMMLNVPTDRLAALAQTHMRARLSPDASGRLGIGLPSWSIVRLRDFFFPMFARLFYEVLFEEVCPDDAAALITASAQNVINALKCTTLRDTKLRDRLTAFVRSKLAEGKLAHVVAEATAGMSDTERAVHVQGVFFHTGCVQMSEAMAHCALAIAQHPTSVPRLTDDQYLDNFVCEVLRTWPLFGIAHRIAAADVTTTGTNGKPVTIRRGTVCCFNYQNFHLAGYTRASEFLPDRWDTQSKKDSNYAPFGVKANRPCPAQRVALILMKAMTRDLAARARLLSPVQHSRSLPSAGPCLLVPFKPVPSGGAAVTDAPPECVSTPPTSVLMSWMKVKDSVDALTRSLKQLVCGTYMVLHAQRLKMAWRYHHEGVTPRGTPRPDYHLAGLPELQ